jgi:hypothetical protein
MAAPPVGREAIWAAMFALFAPLLASAGGPFQTISRRARHWGSDTNPWPALYQLQRHEKPITNERGLPTKWELEGSLYIYAKNEINAAGGDSGGGQILNPLLDAVENALRPLPVLGNVQALGGLVSRVFIDGIVEVDEGNLDFQAVAIIPVRIIVPV